MRTGLINNVEELIRECKSPYNDGFTTFEYKKTLYIILQMIEKEMPSLPTYYGEYEWLAEIDSNK